MDEQELVNQMLELQAANNPSTDPVPPVQNAGSPEPTVATAPEGMPTEGTQAVTPGTTPAAPTPSTVPSAPAPAVEKPVNLEETFDRSNKAWAEQRSKLRKYEELMQRFAQTANIPVADASEAYAKLSGIVTQQEAKSKNLDPIILKTLQEQEAKLAAYEQEEIKKEANASFVELQKQFNLDARDLTAFAKQLSAEGINPFATRGVNLSQHYLSLNYTKLIERAKEQGKLEEIERQKRVAQSTIPGSQIGQNPGQTNVTPQSTGNGFEDLANILGIRR